MRKFSAVVGVLRCIVDRIREYFSMRNAVASQLVRHHRSRITAVLLRQPAKKALGGLAISARLQKHIDHFTVLINRAP